MGQKIHPIGLRLKITRGWDSRWFNDRKKYSEWLHEDIKIRKFVMNKLKGAAVSKVEIERADRIDIIIKTAKPGLVIGKKGAGIEDLKKSVAKLIGNKPIKITVMEIKNAELDAKVIAAIKTAQDAIMSIPQPFRNNLTSSRYNTLKSCSS